MNIKQLDEDNLFKFKQETFLLYSYYKERSFEVTIGRLEMIAELYLSNLKDKRSPEFKKLYILIKEMNAEKSIKWMLDENSPMIDSHSEYIQKILVDNVHSRKSFMYDELNEPSNVAKLMDVISVH